MLVEKVINTGLKQIGKPYVYNAPSLQTNSFDCSSFIQYIFWSNRIILPRNSRQQFQVGKPITIYKLKKGDLLFFTTKSRKAKRGINKIGHVAVYIGDGKILHTYRKGKKVMVTTLNNYWYSVFIGARRVI